MNIPSYYMQVKEYAAPILLDYPTDLTKHDRRMLNMYKGEFIHITRISGTHLYTDAEYKQAASLAPDEYHPYLFSKVKGSEYLDHHHSNLKEVLVKSLWTSGIVFLHGKDGKVKKVSKQKCLTILEKWYSQAKQNR